MRGKHGPLARVLGALVVAVGMVVGLTPSAGATPTVCGWMTVTVDGDPHDVPYIEECDPPPPCGGIVVNLGHHEHDLIVAHVIVDGWLCVRNL